MLIRSDSKFGLTAAQLAGMPARVLSRIAESGPVEAARLQADLPTWEAAAAEAKGKDGKWSVVWPGTIAEADADPVAAAIRLSEVGARNSKADMGHLQTAHDALMKAGAKCSPTNLDSAAEDALDGGADDAAEMKKVKEANVELAGDATAIRFQESAGGEAVLVTLQEAGATFDDANHEVTITPIRPGFGNRRDGRFYPPDSLRKAVSAGLFNGRKMFANHPTKDEEKARPERDVRDWVAVVKETTWDEGRSVPRSRVKVLDDRVWNLWKAAPEHVSFSVLGKGSARSGRVDNRDAQIVESIAHIGSIDWVTEAGAGGAINFAESDHEELENMDFKTMTPAQRAAALADLNAAISEAGDEAESKPKADDKADDKAPAAKAEVNTAVTTPGGGSADASAKPPQVVEPPSYVSREEFDALRAELTASKVREAAADGREMAHDIVDAKLRESHLPKAAREHVAETFRESVVGEGFGYADELAFGAAVEAEIARMARVTEAVSGRRSLVTGLGAGSPDDATGTKTIRESKEADIYARFGMETIPDASAWGPGSVSADGTAAGGRLSGKSADIEASLAGAVTGPGRLA